MDNFSQIILLAPIILFSLVIHEFAHAVTSVRLGDPTPHYQGRITLNPLAHLDPIGTLMIIITMINGVGFGWAKPVQIDPRNYKNPSLGALWVSLAGPTANMILALFFGFLFRFLIFSDFFYHLVDQRLFELIKQFFVLGFTLNISLAFFNLLPIPPLDGSKILRYFLKGKALEYYLKVENYGFFLLLFVIIIFRSALSSILFFIINFLFRMIINI